jgi:transposase-like protein
MKTRQRKLALDLRRNGQSIKEIARRLGVSQSSASIWVRDIELTFDEERDRLERARTLRSQSRRAYFRDRRLEFQAEGREQARRGNAGHATGCMLYWAEGCKSRNAAQFVNSDPAMVRYFVEFLRREFAVPNEALRIDCNLFADHLVRQREIEQFWLDTLGLPASCLRTSTVNVYSKHSQKKRRNKLPYGTVRVCVHSTRIVQSIYGSTRSTAGSSGSSGSAEACSTPPG